MLKKFATYFTCLLVAQTLSAQSLPLDNLKELFGKGKAFKLNGGVNANTVYDAGNDMMGRDPFAYYLNGNVSLNLYGLVDLPFSFSFTNSGTSYQMPSTPNRFNLNPSYKWATAHIGDVSMSFSPYTMNGHIFTGAGVELTPGSWKFAALYGRFLKAVDYEETHPEIAPTYKRMGYGLKAEKQANKYQVSVNVFSAKDNENTLPALPDSLGIALQSNWATSTSFLYKPNSLLKFSGEYGVSFLNQDLRLLDLPASVYHAVKLHAGLMGKTNSIGLGYERIDPNYRTLGAYYFVNDIENITIDAVQKLWQEKANLSVRVGYQHDDIKKRKANESARLVFAANLDAQFSERVNASVSYSNFQNYTNVRSNFELINQENPLDLIDTLNFVQLSQNADLNVAILTKKTEKQAQNLNLTFSYQDASAKRGEATQEGSVSSIINASAAYSCNFLESGLSLTGAMNLNNSKMDEGNALTVGPTIDISSKLWKKKVTLRGSVSYNAGYLDKKKQNEVFLARLNSSYTPAKKHNFNVMYSFQWRSAVNRANVNHSLITAGYAFNF